jgi:hypothetical protein
MAAIGLIKSTILNRNVIFQHNKAGNNGLKQGAGYTFLKMLARHTLVVIVKVEIAVKIHCFILYSNYFVLYILMIMIKKQNNRGEIGP